MKNIKKIIILLFVILLTGCSGTYNLKFNDDLSIKEELNVEIPSTEENKQKTLDLFKNNKINNKKYSIKSSNNKLKIKYSEEYISIEDYIVNSNLYHLLFDNISYDKTDKYIEVEAKNALDLKNNSIYKVNNYDISLFQINLESTHKILSSNYDQKEGNIYSWTLDENTKEKEINFKISTDYYKNRIVYLVPLIIIGLVMVISFIYLYNRIRKTNRL
ncbi:MAG: hypothetical protein IIZ40_00420 [Bacilli bacterium]|nr:hypothetical protein [Bacilli bacterium]